MRACIVRGSNLACKYRCSVHDHAAWTHAFNRRAACPVLDQIDAGDDVDDRHAVERQHAGVAGHEQTIRLVELHADVELRERPGHHLADADRRRVEIVVQQAGERHLLNAADRVAVVQDRQLRDAAGLQQIGGLGSRRLRARWSRGFGARVPAAGRRRFARAARPDASGCAVSQPSS